MEILVLVENKHSWNAFLSDLGELWAYKFIRPDRVAIGNITYQACLMSSDRWQGLIPERVYVYNYTASKSTKKTGVVSKLSKLSKLDKPMVYFEMHGVEIVYIETDWGYV